MRFVRPVGPVESPGPVGPIESASASGIARHEHRQLGGGDGGYLVDSNGNELASYSLSWRYLGVFIDNNNCDNRRKLGDNNNNKYCRKVLWAAYHNPDYGGQGIAEYSFYQRESGKWDSSTCRAQTNGYYWPGTECRKLDCHLSGTKLELVGVFKETDGLYDFTEQLFKHQGYCLWDGDKQYGDGESHHSDDEDGETSNYKFMQNLQENWVYGCTQLENAEDADGNSLYYDTKPLPGGDMTYGVYTDSSCTVESRLTWSDILSKMADYNSNDNDDDGMPSMDSIERWNALLGDYKICQPCRAYNRVVTSDGSSDSHSDGSEGSEDYYNDAYDGDDGEGGKDRYGFNCYDDAGYRNCNQCYKFQTQTNMERASTSDLVLATAQGTILGVEVNGVSYGKGHYAEPGLAAHAVSAVTWALVVPLSAAALVFAFLYCYGKRLRRARRVGADGDGLEENLRGGGRRSRSRSRSRHRGRGDDNWRVYVRTARQKLRADANALGARLGFSEADLASDAQSSLEGKKKKFTYADCKKKYLVAQLENRDARLAEQAVQMRDLREKVNYYKYLLDAAGAPGAPAADEEQGGAGAGEVASQGNERSGMPSSARADVEQRGSDPGGEAPQGKRQSEANYYKHLLSAAGAAGASGAPTADEEQQGAGAGDGSSQDKERSGTPPSAKTEAEQQGSDPGGETPQDKRQSGASSDAAAATGVPVMGQQGSGLSGEMKYSTLHKRRPENKALKTKIAAAEQMKEMAEMALTRIKAREAQQRGQDDDDDVKS